MVKGRNFRWVVVALIMAATALNYLDRQTLPVVVVEVQKDIPLTDAQYSQVQFLFLLAYGLMYAVGGSIVDALGTRLGYLVMIVWWSAANAMHGFADSAWSLGAFRFLLGLGEGGGFPASAKGISEWFSPAERSFAFGLFNTGSSIGAVAAPPLIAWIVSVSDWRWVFFVTGAAGIVWALGWFWLYRIPADAALEKALERAPPVRWIDLLRYREVQVLVVAKFLSDAGWFFFAFWLPKYLADARHLDLKSIGASAWIPYAAAGVGSFVGGLLSSYLIRRGCTVNASRKIALTCAALLMPSSLLVAGASLNVALGLFSLAFLGHQFWSTIVQTLPADLFPPSCVGRVAGLLGAAGSFGGMLFNLAVGWWLTEYHSYSAVMTVAGLLHPLSLLLILLLITRIERLSLR